jgi:hypothetical protein
MILAVTMIGLAACAHNDTKPVPAKAATGYKK